MRCPLKIQISISLLCHNLFFQNIFPTVWALLIGSLPSSVTSCSIVHPSFSLSWGSFLCTSWPFFKQHFVSVYYVEGILVLWGQSSLLLIGISEADGEGGVGTGNFERLSQYKRPNSGGQIVKARDKFILSHSSRPNWILKCAQGKETFKI